MLGNRSAASFVASFARGWHLPGGLEPSKTEMGTLGDKGAVLVTPCDNPTESQSPLGVAALGWRLWNSANPPLGSKRNQF